MFKHITIALAAMVVLAGCNSPTGSSAPATGSSTAPVEPATQAIGNTITGTATLREPMPVGEGARLELKLVDVAMPDIVIAESTETVTGQPPFAFTLAFDPARIDRTKTYVVNALLFDGDRRFVPALQSPVLTGGAGNTVAIVMNAEATAGENVKEEFNKLKAHIGGMKRIQDAYLDGDLSVAWDGFYDASNKIRFMRVNSETGEGETAQRSNVEYAFLDDKPMAILKRNAGNTRVGWNAQGEVVLNERSGGTVSEDEAKAFYADAVRALAMGQAKLPKKK